MKILKNLSKIHAVFGKWRQLIDLGRYRFMWHRKQWALLKEIPSLRSMKDIKFNLTDPAQNEAVQRFIMLVGIWWKHGWLVMNGNAVRSSEEIITNTPEHNLSSSLGIPHRPLPSSSIKIDSWNAGHIVLQRTKPILLLFLIENCSAFFNGKIPLLKLLFFTIYTLVFSPYPEVLNASNQRKYTCIGTDVYLFGAFTLNRFNNKWNRTWLILIPWFIFHAQNIGRHTAAGNMYTEGVWQTQ